MSNLKTYFKKSVSVCKKSSLGKPGTLQYHFRPILVNDTL